MIELSEQNVTDYLRSTGRVTPADQNPQPLLIQALSGGVANVVLKIFDPSGGPKVGTDMRSPAQIKRNAPDKRMNFGECLVLKQPLPKFKTAAEWLVDIDRVHVERDCMTLLSQLLPAGSVPDVLWFDSENYVLAMSCAPTESVIWKKHLLAGSFLSEAAQQAGMLLAIMHTSTNDDPAAKARYGDRKFFIQQRTDPYLQHLKTGHPDLAATIDSLTKSLLEDQHCLIHGDFSPKNIFLVPRKDADTDPLPSITKPTRPKFALSHLLLLDFEVAFFGHPSFDVATLINHLLLKAFYLGKPWRAGMIAIDAFQQTYLHTVDDALGKMVETTAGQVLGALLLARVDGKSPAEYITDDALKARIRQTARKILKDPDTSLEAALDHAATTLTEMHG